LHSGDHWKKFLWCSRAGDEYPPEIRAKAGAARIIIGPVSINATSDFKQGALTDWNKIGEKIMYMRRGEIGIQYVWKGISAMNSVVEPNLDLLRFHVTKNDGPNITHIANPWYIVRLIYRPRH
jgi:hypothetical protein